MVRRVGWWLLVVLLAAVVIPRTAPTRAASTSVVISEFRTRGPAGGNDEFVELFNLSTAAVDIGGWKISGSNAAATTATRLTIPASTRLQPGQHYLAVNRLTSGGYSGTVAGDNPSGFTVGIPDDGGVALLDAASAVVDKVGMSLGSAYGEGTRLPSFGGVNSDRSYRRGDPCADRDDNAVDFSGALPSTPANSAAAPTPCAAPVSPTATALPSVTTTATPRPTATATPSVTPPSTGTPTVVASAPPAPVRPWVWLPLLWPVAPTPPPF